MHYYLLIFTLLSMCLCVSKTSAQDLNRQEKKALEKELKSLSRDLDRFKEIKDEDKTLQQMIARKRTTLAQEFSVLNQKQDSLNQLEKRLMMQRDNAWQLSNRLTSSFTQDAEVLFRVQIGAYRNPKLAKMLSEQGSFFMDDSPQGIKRYMIGTFNSYGEAKSFANELSGSGAQAFVVGYLQGNRIENLKQMPEKYF